jgi:hypothetical protein
LGAPLVGVVHDDLLSGSAAGFGGACACSGALAFGPGRLHHDPDHAVVDRLHACLPLVPLEVLVRDAVDDIQLRLAAGEQDLRRVNGPGTGVGEFALQAPAAPTGVKPSAWAADEMAALPAVGALIGMVLAALVLLPRRSRSGA